MASPIIYRVYLKCRADESNQMIFEGTMSQMIRQFGPRSSGSLRPYLEGQKIYNYTFSICINYRWKAIADPRPGPDH